MEFLGGVFLERTPEASTCISKSIFCPLEKAMPGNLKSLDFTQDSMLEAGC